MPISISQKILSAIFLTGLISGLYLLFSIYKSGSIVELILIAGNAAALAAQQVKGGKPIRYLGAAYSLLLGILGLTHILFSIYLDKNLSLYAFISAAFISTIGYWSFIVLLKLNYPAQTNNR